MNNAKRKRVPKKGNPKGTKSVFVYPHMHSLYATIDCKCCSLMVMGYGLWRKSVSILGTQKEMEISVRDVDFECKTIDEYGHTIKRYDDNDYT